MMSWRRLLSQEVISINQVTVVVRTAITHIHFTTRGVYYCFVLLPKAPVAFSRRWLKAFWFCKRGGFAPAVEVKIREREADMMEMCLHFSLFQMTFSQKFTVSNGIICPELLSLVLFFGLFLKNNLSGS